MDKTQVIIICKSADRQRAMARMLHYLHHYQLEACWSSPSMLQTVEQPPQLVIMDAAFNQLLQNLPETWAKTKWIVLAGNETEAADALFAGAHQYVMNHDDPEVLPRLVEETVQSGNQASLSRIIQRIKEQTEGQVPEDPADYDLTSKEKRILQLMYQGVHLKGIAQQTNNSYETIRTHVKRIYRKLNVGSASEAVVKAMKLKF
jgi:DNA-binding NarL/FixJ family response regulator